ncbi:MAG TPA: bifunctional 4-hydroxy-2-oxoglutarate aldolase/2-dehydro-3-deoxy-phosphogluconate aldolase [Candidatus Polarisedimenticolia bacterium]|nr:bifunctional 4-hydroxy-2-oxoglutarate aldolase/2-dehydro-3-deoxy-phosphogluconate aldolase [Candidatus Polarisedimenticolia bacterium]
MTANPEGTLQELLREGAVLAVRLPAGADLPGACRAAVRGGVRVLEITLTTPSALEAIALMSREPGVIAGGGTVLTVDDARGVARAGGRFALSPVFEPAVMEEARRLGLVAIPGAGSASEILAAHRHGAPVVKVFPSGALGGPAFLRAIRGPFPAIPLLPTSGPTAENLAGYFDAGAAAVGIGGAEFFPPGWTVDSVEAAARRVRAALDARPTA